MEVKCLFSQFTLRNSVFLGSIVIALAVGMTPNQNADRPLADYDRMVRVLCEIENGQWGQRGGAACMRYIAWKQHTMLSYQLSRHRIHAIPVYKQHLEWLKQQVAKVKTKVTFGHIACAWRYGLEGAKEMGFKSDYATRAQNLYDDNNR